jgi:putative lipoprotein
VGYDPGVVDPRRTYALDARIVVDNKVAFLLEEPAEVLTLGKPKDDVDLILEVADEALVDRLSAAPFEATSMSVSALYQREIPLPETALLQVEVVDPNAADANTAVLALAELPVGGLETPILLDVPIEQPVNEDAAYLLVGRIILDGETAFEATGVPVLTQGAPLTNVELPLVAVGAEAARQREVAVAGLSGQIDGILTYLQRVALDPTAQAYILLRPSLPGDVQTATPVVATLEFATEGLQPPLPFLFFYPREEIDPDAAYLMEAGILVNGEVEWVTEVPRAVLTQGATSTGIDLILSPSDSAPDAAQRVADAVAQAQADALAAAGVLPEGAPAGSAATVTFEEHVVLPGETLSSIAQIYDVTIEALRAANALQGDLIRAGDTLRVPIPVEQPAQEQGAEEPAGTEAAGATPTPETTGESAVETEVTGDQVITGTVSYRQRIALPAGALVEVQLIDVSASPPAVVAMDTVTTTGEQVPIAWSLQFAPNEGEDGRSYGLAARISIDGVPRFASAELTPARTAGEWRTGVDLLVVPAN